MMNFEDARINQSWLAREFSRISTLNGCHTLRNEMFTCAQEINDA